MNSKPYINPNAPADAQQNQRAIDEANEIAEIAAQAAADAGKDEIAAYDRAYRDALKAIRAARAVKPA